MNMPAKIISLVFLFLLFASPSDGQTTKPSDKPAPAILADSSRRNLDEAFELNIDLRRITREGFEASTAISTDPESDVQLRVGVGVTADRIDAQLKNVRGLVRFRASLDRIFEVLNGKRPATAVPQ